jgi:hypothetical protein
MESGQAVDPYCKPNHKILGLTGYLLVALFSFCDRHQPQNEKQADPLSSPVSIQQCFTQQGSYDPGAVVKISCTLSNTLSTSAEIKDLKVKVADLSKPSYFPAEVVLESSMILKAGESFSVDSVPIWTVPADAPKDAYGVYISYSFDGGQESISYQTFFRVTDEHTLTTYQIQASDYQGLDIFKLDGGMSAEYAVEKSLENLAPSVSHSWVVSAPGSGPRPVYATPGFLQQAVAQTVNIYNDILGAGTAFNTVIISTGIPSIPYFSNALNAPVLPLHFLAGVNTEKEIQSVMDYSNRHGLRSYATLGYDLSVVPAVAWIKLLDLPDAYLQFLKQHDVKNVLIVGADATSSGETMARQVLNSSRGAYQPGSIYILYPGNTPNDAATLSQRIVDLNQVAQTADLTHIADWESGIIPDQIHHFSDSIKAKTGIRVWSVTAADLIGLYDLSTYTTLAFFKKNDLQVNGVAINPYLIAHPCYEAWKGFIPFNYWQGNTPQNTVARILGTTQTAVAGTFPQVPFKALGFWVNSSRNFGGSDAAYDLVHALSSSGISHIIENDYTRDEVWSQSSGMRAVCEKIAVELTTGKQLTQYKQWRQSLVPLDIRDLFPVAAQIPDIKIQEQ